MAGSLTPIQWATIEAASARLLPSDHHPGAREAQVVNYIDAQLALPHFELFRKMFIAGIRQINRLALRSGQKRFAACSAAQQDAVLRQIERGVPMGRRWNSHHFFRILLTLTLEGLLGDPVYGGNRNQLGWQMINFAPRPPRPTRPYRSGA